MNTEVKTEVKTNLQKRQEATAAQLRNRLEAAQGFIKKHEAKLEEKLAPYRAEVQVVKKMLEDHYEANPELRPEAVIAEQNQAAANSTLESGDSPSNGELAAGRIAEAAGASSEAA